MADILDKVIETAKKLRKAAKRIDDTETQNLIVDLNLSLADLKVQLLERDLEKQQQTPQSQSPQDDPAPTGNDLTTDARTSDHNWNPALTGSPTTPQEG
jgi:hypothetical protein